MKLIQSEDVYQLMKWKFMSIGLSSTDAINISRSLVDTSLNGIDTHGIRLFSCYLLELENGRAKQKPQLKFENCTPVSSVLDANHANGIVAGIVAMNHAIQKAKTIGMAAVVVKNSNHFGAASIYTRLATEQKCIGLCMSNSDALVALQGGNKPFLGTNPISVSVPGKQENQFHFDFATSQVAYSKIKEYAENDQKLPVGWAVDEHGEDSAYSQSMHALQSLGGYKGQGLGMMVQMFTCILSGMPFDHKLSHLYGEPYDSPRQVSHFFMCINPEIFMPVNELEERVDQLFGDAEENTENFVFPGKKEYNIRQLRIKKGIPLSVQESSFFEELRVEQKVEVNDLAC